MPTEEQLTFRVSITRHDNELISVGVDDGGDVGRILTGRRADAWLLAQHAGELIGLSIQEAAIRVRGSKPAPAPFPKTRAKKKAAKKKAGRKAKKRK